MAFIHSVNRAVAGTALAVLAAMPIVARAQSAETRFAVTSVGDSTLNFSVGSSKWMQRGQKGIVVDPRRQDVLIARIAVLSVSGSTATAVITGQTTPVETTHIAVFERPVARIYKRNDFWIGVAIGAVAGLLGGAAF